MNIGECLLLLLSRKTENSEYFSDNNESTIDSALSLLESEYPNFGNLISGKRVVDFGCGSGYQSILLVKKYGCSAVGIESNKKRLEKALENAKYYNIPEAKLCFVEKKSLDMEKKFDIVISQNSFEHFKNSSLVLGEMKSLINDSGKILITFGPPWLAPYGSHMHFFCKVPWINIFFSEETVMKVRKRFRSD